MAEVPDYPFTRTKRAVDLTLAGIATPLTPLIWSTLRWYLREQPIEQDRNPIFKQERIGANGAAFIIHKWRTLDSDNENEFGPLTATMRDYGLDETLQAPKNVITGDMSITGHRALMARDLNPILTDPAIPWQTRKDWVDLVLPTKPGAISSFSITNHQESSLIVERGEEMLTYDIEDRMNASFMSDVKLIARVVRAGIAGEL